MLIIIGANAQTLDDWTAESGITVKQISNPDSVSEGTYAAGITWTTNKKSLDYGDTITVPNGANFELKAKILDNTKSGRARLVIMALDAGDNMYGDYSKDNANFQECTHTGKLKDATTKIKIRFRFYDKSGGGTDPKNIVIDSVALKINGSPVTVKNFGFENWTTGSEDVDNIAALRTKPDGSKLYKLTGEAVLSYALSARHQKYIQDATGGILIDDDGGKITTTYAQYDGITGITGTIGSYKGIKQFKPTADPGAASSTGNTITPEEVTISAIKTSIDSYESELITIKDVEFVETGTFAAKKDYHIFNGTDTIVLRTFGASDTDIDGESIPTGTFDLTCIAGEYSGTPQVYPRNMSDLAIPVITPTKLLVTAVAPSIPKKDENFSVTIKSVDASGKPGPVTSDTGIKLAKKTGAGTLGGTLTATITSGKDAVVISNLTYSVAEKFILTAEQTSGMTLTISDDKEIEVKEVKPPTKLVIKSVTPVSPKVNETFAVVVETQDADGTPQNVTSDTDVKIALKSKATLGGTTTKTISTGSSSVTFSDLTYDEAGDINLTVSATSGMTALTAATTSSAITIQVDAGTTEISIHDIQYTTDASGDSPQTGQVVTTQGIVTALKPAGSKKKGGFFIQDAAGEWNGLYVFTAVDPTVKVGDKVKVKGLIKEHFNMTEMARKDASNPLEITEISTGNDLPEATVVKTGEVTEGYEGVLIKFKNAECTEAPDKYGTWKVNDGSGEGFVDDWMYRFKTAATGTRYDITGCLAFDFSKYKIMPRKAEDIATGTTAITTLDANVKIYPNPVTNILKIEGDVTNVEIFNTMGQKAEVNFSDNSINVSGLESGVYVAKISLKSGKIIQHNIIKN